MNGEKRDASNDGPTANEAKRPSFSEDGVDLTLIRWMLSLTPAERLSVAQNAAQSLQRLRDESSRS